MMERDDLLVVHEPFSYLYYVHEERGQAPHLRLDKSKPRTYGAIRESLLESSQRQPVFFKDMAYHCLGELLADDELLRVARHVFLIRDPAQAIASYYAVDPKCSLEEMGIESLCLLFRRVRQLVGEMPLVISAESLVEDPEGELARLSEFAGLPTLDGVTTWQPGHRSEWDSWREWHRGAAESSGIHAHSTSYEHTVFNHDALRGYYDHHLPFYRELARFAGSTESLLDASVPTVPSKEDLR